MCDLASMVGSKERRINCFRTMLCCCGTKSTILTAEMAPESLVTTRCVSGTVWVYSPWKKDAKKSPFSSFVCTVNCTGLRLLGESRDGVSMLLLLLCTGFDAMSSALSEAGTLLLGSLLLLMEADFADVGVAVDKLVLCAMAASSSGTTSRDGDANSVGSSGWSTSVASSLWSSSSSSLSCGSIVGNAASWESGSTTRDRSRASTCDFSSSTSSSRCLSAARRSLSCSARTSSLSASFVKYSSHGRESHSSCSFVSSYSAMSWSPCVRMTDSVKPDSFVLLLRRPKTLAVSIPLCTAIDKRCASIDLPRFVDWRDICSSVVVRIDRVLRGCCCPECRSSDDAIDEKCPLEDDMLLPMGEPWLSVGEPIDAAAISSSTSRACCGRGDIIRSGFASNLNCGRVGEWWPDDAAPSSCSSSPMLSRCICGSTLRLKSVSLWRSAVCARMEPVSRRLRPEEPREGGTVVAEVGPSSDSDGGATARKNDFFDLSAGSTVPTQSSSRPCLAN
eukprot:PhM_4_TR3398/c0_g1_i1/m.78376